MPNTRVSAGFGPDSHLNLDISLFLSDSTSARRHQFGVMFFPDKLQGYKEARRVLRPGGHSWRASLLSFRVDYDLDKPRLSE
jgi:ubiquinone/menaquinone biosynthesis C-methylase UbiE